jgi:hypothetical protein
MSYLKGEPDRCWDISCPINFYHGESVDEIRKKKLACLDAKRKEICDCCKETNSDCFVDTGVGPTGWEQVCAPTVGPAHPRKDKHPNVIPTNDPINSDDSVGGVSGTSTNNGLTTDQMLLIGGIVILVAVVVLKRK